MTIGLVLMIGAVQVYVDSSKSYAVNDTTARLQENARYAMSVLEPTFACPATGGSPTSPTASAGKRCRQTLNSPPSAPRASTCGVNFRCSSGSPCKAQTIPMPRPARRAAQPCQRGHDHRAPGICDHGPASDRSGRCASARPHLGPPRHGHHRRLLSGRERSDQQSIVNLYYVDQS